LPRIPPVDGSLKMPCSALALADCKSKMAKKPHGMNRKACNQI
jgi:hypothetical protein